MSKGWDARIPLTLLRYVDAFCYFTLKLRETLRPVRWVVEPRQIRHPAASPRESLGREYLAYAVQYAGPDDESTQTKRGENAARIIRKRAERDHAAMAAIADDQRRNPKKCGNP